MENKNGHKKSAESENLIPIEKKKLQTFRWLRKVSKIQMRSTEARVNDDDCSNDSFVW